MNIQTGKKEENLAKVEKVLQMDRMKDVELLVVPELFSTGFDYIHIAEIAEKIDSSQTLENLIDMSQNYRTGIAGSVLIKDVTQSYLNIGFIISPTQGLIYKYQKIHLWGNEKNYFTAGSHVPPPVDFESKAKIGLVICYDLRFPEVYRKLAIQGAEIIITPAAWPAQRYEHFRLLTQARALENTCYHIAVNRFGEEKSPDYVKYRGDSQIVSPSSVLLETGSESDQLLITTLSKNDLEETRKRIPVLRDRKLEL